jgi:hypothetical protein
MLTQPKQVARITEMFQVRKEVLNPASVKLIGDKDDSPLLYTTKQIIC